MASNTWTSWFPAGTGTRTQEELKVYEYYGGMNPQPGGPLLQGSRLGLRGVGSSPLCWEPPPLDGWTSCSLDLHDERRERIFTTTLQTREEEEASSWLAEPIRETFWLDGRKPTEETAEEEEFPFCSVKLLHFPFFSFLHFKTVRITFQSVSQ